MFECVDFDKVLMYLFHYGYIKNKYGNNSRPLLIVWCMKLKLKISKNKKMFNFSNYSAESKYFNDSNKLVVFYKMKVETSVAVNKRCVGLKPKM